MERLVFGGTTLKGLKNLRCDPVKSIAEKRDGWPFVKEEVDAAPRMCSGIRIL
jgi:hypothetical protein